MKAHRGVVVMALVLATAGAGVGVALAVDDGGGGGSGGDGKDNTGAASGYQPKIDPARFTAEVDNPYFPLRPGTRWVYEGPSSVGLETNVVEVTSDTRQVMGVTCVVVHDTVSVGGEVTEETYDWYAQDDQGNVWYFGEDTAEYEHGKVVSRHGAWEAGRDGAQPGIIMRAHPKVGDHYRQEYYQGEAEDMADVLALAERVTVPFGSFDGVLETKDYTPLEPNAAEHKYYARGVGTVLEVSIRNGTRVELIELTLP